jgi:hypothetical protein
MTRRENLAVLAAATAVAASGKETGGMYQQLFETSMNEKKGVNVYLKGQAIPGVVTKIASDHIEMRSREYSRIVVRLEAIDAVALS